MRRGLIVLMILVVAALVAAVGVFAWAREHASPMSWLRSEFSLDGRRAESVARIHAEYETDCARMCARIAETDQRLTALISSSRNVTPEIREAIIESDRVRSECRTKMLEHFYRIAAELPSERRTEYLEVVLPAVLRPGDMAQLHSR
jgi:hypothetical protein